MDNFKIPKIDFPDEDALAWDVNKEEQKIIKTAQFKVSEKDAMLAIAMKNYWLYQYDLKKK